MVQLVTAPTCPMELLLVCSSGLPLIMGYRPFETEDGSIDSSQIPQQDFVHSSLPLWLTTTAVHSKAEVSLDFGGGGGGRQPLEGSRKAGRQAEGGPWESSISWKTKKVLCLFVFLPKKILELAKYTSRHSTKSIRQIGSINPKEMVYEISQGRSSKGIKGYEMYLNVLDKFKLLIYFFLFLLLLCFVWPETEDSGKSI